MSFVKEIYDVGKDVRTARKEYLKNQAKDEYIKVMENQLDELLTLLDSLNTKLEEYELEHVLSLNDNHLKILKMFQDSKTGSLVDTHIFPDFSIDDRIAFEELHKHGFLSNYHKNTYGQTVYFLAKDRMVEVFKALKAYGK